MPLLLSSAIAGTRIDRSKNPRLRRVFEYVKQYNSLPATADTNLRIDLLHIIVREAGDYFTSKPPQLSWKNQGRWDGLRELLEQVGPEMKQLGAKGLKGPTDWKKISGHERSYWLELLDPMHRPGYVLSPKFQQWLNDPEAIRLKTSFWVHLNGGLGTGLAVSPEFKNDVVFLPETGEAKKHQMTLNDEGKLIDSRGDAFTSRDQKTAFSGNGWAIWVCSPTREIYAGSHVVGKFHHSSFLGGRPVMAAGEMVIDEDGLIRVITAKSGHYTPSSDDMLRFVQAFPMLPSGAVIFPDLSDTQNNMALFYFVGEFRDNPKGCRPLSKQEVMNVVPSWARSSDAMKTFDLVPDAVGGRRGRKLASAR